VDAARSLRGSSTRATRSVALAIAVLLGTVLVAACEPGPQPGCTLAPTDGLQRFTVGERSYLALVPDGLAAQASTGIPLVVSLHGLNSNATQMAGYTPWVDLAPSEGFIAVFPEGVDQTWAIAQGSPDVTFLREVITEVSARWCVAPKRVHVNGHSMGAYMAQRMACDAADLVASVAEYAGGPPTLGGSPCTPSRAIAIAMFHGDADRLVRIQLGQASRDEWRDRLDCNATPTTEVLADGTVTTFDSCTEPGDLSWRVYAGQGHLWPTGAKGLDLRDRMWAWFEAHPRP
jgi:polyhydroxybutyrate depolymerase